jgi:HEAT repeat protein
MFAPPPLPRTLEASVRDLSSAKPGTRASAIVDLARHAARDDGTRAKAVPMLEKALHDEAPAVRSAAAVALGDLGAKEALAALLVAMEDADVHTRQMAINALGEIGDVRAAPRLVRALTDRRPEVRYQALIAWSRVEKDGEEVTAALLRALDDDDDAVRYIALRIAEERFDRGLGGGFEDLSTRARLLVQGPVPHVALAAAIFLAKLGQHEGHALILRVIEGTAKRGSGDKEDEREAVEIAGALGLRETIPALERRAWGVTRIMRDTCAFHAKIALARMGHERAVREILRDLESKKRGEREAAVVAAGRARLVQARVAIETLADVDPELVSDALAALDGTSARRAESAG